MPYWSSFACFLSRRTWRAWASFDKLPKPIKFIRYADCERDTKYLNGGEKVFVGRKFNIILCGNGGDEDSMHDKDADSFRKRGVAGATNVLCGLERAGPFELACEDEHLTYFDATKDSNFENKASMPTTWLDRSGVVREPHDRDSGGTVALETQFCRFTGFVITRPLIPLG